MNNTRTVQPADITFDGQEELQKPINFDHAPPVDGWGELAVSTPIEPPLKAGDHPGVIEKIRVGDASDGQSLWLCVNYAVDNSDAEIVPEFATLAAKPGSPAEKRIADGLRLLNRLSNATGVALPPNLKPSEIAGLFEGCQVTVRVGVRKRDGLPELVVRGLKKAAA